MKVYVVNDSFCSVYGVYQNFADAEQKFEEIVDRLQRERDIPYVGRSKFHIWWDNEYGEQLALHITEAELK